MAGQDKKAYNIIKTIVSLSHDLGIACVAEGVETAEHAALLSDSGCHLMQGFHFARPMPLCDLLAQVSTSNAPRSRITG
jgi:EAL domain-containing protein (putative c-di-GMP-specific phosphodiesterase class I)